MTVAAFGGYVYEFTWDLPYTEDGNLIQQYMSTKVAQDKIIIWRSSMEL